MLWSIFEKCLPSTRSKLVAATLLLAPTFVYKFFVDLPASWLPASDSEAFLWRLLSTAVTAFICAMATLVSVLYDYNSRPDIKAALEEARKRVHDQQSNRVSELASQPKAVDHSTSEVLSPELCNLMVYLFTHDDEFDRDVGKIAKSFSVEPAMARYHLDRLSNKSLVVITGGNYALGHTYYALTEQGRAYVVENNLLQPKSDDLRDA
jgi:DNA-binding MarR family transcriptional regulator